MIVERITGPSNALGSPQIIWLASGRFAGRPVLAEGNSRQEAVDNWNEAIAEARIRMMPALSVPFQLKR